MSTLLPILSFLAAFCLAQCALLATLEWNGGRRRLRQRLERVRRSYGFGATDPSAGLSILRERRRRARADSNAPVDRWLAPLRRLLEGAGRPLGVSAFFVLCGASAAVGVLIASWFFGDTRLGLPFIGLAAFPWLWLAWRKRVRMRRFELMFPEALDLLSRALRAGHALSAGLHMVGEELADPVGPEFERISEEIRLGLDMPQALSNLTERLDVPEIPFFVTALVIQRETGGNLAEIIDNLSRVLRERHAMNGKVRAVTAQTRWSANLLVCAPFAFTGAMALLRRDYIAPLWETPSGNKLCVIALVLVLLGWAVCRRVGVVRV
jgi:tight adherence protein B